MGKYIAVIYHHIYIVENQDFEIYVANKLFQHCYIMSYATYKFQIYLRSYKEEIYYFHIFKINIHFEKLNEIIFNRF